MRPQILLEAVDLTKSYGDIEAVRGLSFSLGQGEILGLLGPNGAGKTTTVDMLTTLTSIDRGRAIVAGYDVATQPSEVRRRIGLAGQASAVDEMLTARENLTLFGRLYKLRGPQLRRRVEEVVEQFRLAEFADRRTASYSGGQRRRLDIAAALIGLPPVVFLDEPTTGLDPRSRAELWQVVTDLAARGVAVVLTTHYLEEADRLADRIVVLDKGRSVAQGSPTTLKRALQQEVLEIDVASDADAEVAAALVGSSHVRSRSAKPQVKIAMGDDGPAPLRVLRDLEDAGVGIVEFQLRRPTLDDVFLSLTQEAAR